MTDHGIALGGRMGEEEEGRREESKKKNGNKQ